MAEKEIPKQQILLGIFAWRLGYLKQQQLSQAIDIAISDGKMNLEQVLVEMQLLTSETLQSIKSLLKDQQEQDRSVLLTVLGADDETVNSVVSSESMADSIMGLSPVTDSLAANSQSRLAVSLELQKKEIHAEGGLGRVIRASDQFLGRDVAVKEIQPEIADSKSAQARFVREAQITSRLQHPGVVPVHLCGVDERGKPFYIMQLIQGKTLGDLIRQFHGGDVANASTDFESLEFRNLIDVFTDVAQTASYAHSKKILHRDLKPQNVLVGNYGETLVIDWGLACDRSGDGEEVGLATDNDRLTPDKTRQGQILGTIGYAAPEQVKGDIDEVSERSDVYALGAILYEILVGTPPHVPSQNGAMEQWVRQVLDVRPREPRSIRSTIPKSLSAIAMKAIEFDAQDRYSSVDALVDDLNRWKADQEVSAVADSPRDKLARWGRKYRQYAWFAATALLAISIVSLVALFLVNQSRINEAAAKGQANALATRNQNVVEAFVEAFESPNPENEGATALMSAADVLVQAKSRFESNADFDDDKLTQSSVLDALGRSLYALGRYPESVVALKEALSASESSLGKDHPTTLEYMNNLARALLAEGAHDEAVAMHQNCLAARQRVLGASHAQTLTSQNNLALAKEVVGDIDDAVTLLRKTLDQQKQVLGDENDDTFGTMQNLAFCLQSDGKLDEAIQYYLASLEGRKKSLGDDHPRTVDLMSNLALCYEQAGKYKDARKMALDALERREQKLGADHPHTLFTMGNLARVYEVDGQHKEAIKINELLLERLKIKLGSQHPKTLQIMNNLASTYQQDGRFEDAATLMLETMNLFREKLGADHHRTYTCMSNLASIYESLGRYDESIEYYQKVLDFRVEKLGKDHPSTLICMSNFAYTLESAGKYEKALPMYEEAYQLFLNKLGPEHPNTVGAISNLASIYDAVGKLDKALPLYEKTYVQMGEVVGQDHPRTLIGGHNLAVAYVRAKRIDDAIPVFEKMLPKMKEVFGEAHFRTKECIKNTAIALEKADRKSEAIALYKQLVVLANDDTKTAKKWQDVVDELSTESATRENGKDKAPQEPDEG